MATLRKKFETIDEYITIFPKNVQEILETLRKVIRESAPEAEETISYAIPTLSSMVKIWCILLHIKIILDFIPRLRALKRLKKNSLTITPLEVQYNFQ